jgi:hypothetical protein
MHALLSRNVPSIGWTNGMYKVFSRHFFHRKFNYFIKPLPAPTPCKQQHSAFELPVYWLPR